MKTIDIDFYPEEPIGVIKKINGGNLAPPVLNEKAGGNIRESFAALNMPLTRLHDAPLENAGYRLVDITMIFPHFHADENDHRNYYFRQTDDYINNCIQTNTDIYYRLGISIEHGVNKYFTDPPEDVEKWINVCDHIIRHYTQGWADGFYLKIKYWEIWNEPEIADADGLKLMWNASLEEFNRFYARVARELKHRFPHLSFGGPSHCGYGSVSDDFIDYCAVNNAPLDFYSCHCYSADPHGKIIDVPEKIRAKLDSAGYRNSAIHINEWHYFPGDWKRMRSDYYYRKSILEEVKGIHSAAFLCAVLSQWQDTPLDMACYYTATATMWGLYETSSSMPTKSYYGMKAFGEIVRYKHRLKIISKSHGVTVLAGQDNHGKHAMLISCFKTGSCSLNIRYIANACPATAHVFMLDSEHDLKEVSNFSIEDSRLSIKLRSDSGVVLVISD